MSRFDRKISRWILRQDRSLRIRSRQRFDQRRLLFEGLEQRQLLATFGVINTADSGVGSLRQAIIDANANTGADLISFNIPGGGVQTIQPLSPLPAITSPVTIDGYTQPGSSPNTLADGDNATINIELDGSLAGNSHGIYVTAGNSTVKGLAINRFSVAGIRLENAGSNVVTGNFIGIDVSGTQARANGVYGVSMFFSDDNVIGTNSDGVDDAAERNVVAGNNIGVRVEASHRNVVAGNYVGTDKNGTAALPNSEGIWVLSGASNTIGGTTAGAGNLVSGNLYYGIHVQGNGANHTGNSTADHNVVQGNFVGTDVSGTLALPNGGFGMLINSNDNTVGGAAVGARNLVSGNSTGVGGDGIQVIGHRNIVQGNYVGTDVTGTLPLGNGVVGGGFFVQSNGISVQGTGNVIGGIAAGQGNLVANNFGAGVAVTYAGVNVSGASTTGNTVRGNSIFANGGLGIDLAYVAAGFAGVTPNDAGDADDGPNNFQNFPLIATAVSSGSGTMVSGTLNSTANSTFTLDFYANPSADPSGFGEGQTHLGSAQVTTDGSGNATFTASVPGIAPAGQFVSATATDASGNTSEFSGNGSVVPCIEAASLVVTTTADVVANDCVTSLREAINFANATPGLDTITFHIPGSGMHTIQPLSQLPTITDSVTIDGYTQLGSSQNTLAGANDADLRIELDGSLAGTVDGLFITAGGSTVRGLVINRFQRDGIRLEQGGGNVIEGNFIGTDPTGSIDLGNGLGGFGGGSSASVRDYYGIRIANGSSSNRIGTNGDTVDDASERNLISGNEGGDIAIVGGSSDFNVVAGNLIGTDRTGTQDLSVDVIVTGEALGVSVSSGAHFNRIGTNGDGVADEIERNVISGHETGGSGASEFTSGRGVVLYNTQDNVVAGNYIGTDITGTLPLGNAVGVLAFLTTGANRIGTNADGVADDAERNIIAGNLSYGVALVDSNGDLVAGNYVGTDVTGLVARPNGTGVGLFNSANAQIGGTATTARNIISGNSSNGVFAQTGSRAGSVIQGNYIGVDASGGAALPNQQNGVSLGTNIAGLLIGGTDTGAGNVISGNLGHGILVANSTQPTIQGNFIGTNAIGATNLGNQMVGVFVYTNTLGTQIGGVLPGAGNTIAHNLSDGVFVFSGTGHTIRGNSIHSNGGLGIDIDPNNPNGIDVGDVDAGPNIRQNFPSLTSASSFGGGTYVTGSLNSTADTTFTLDFYSNSAADPSGFGEGEAYLGSANVTTDATGNVSFAVTVPGIAAAGSVISAAATGPNGNTSEFSGITASAPFEPATISGTKYHDLNGNGTRDGAATSSGPVTVPGTSDPWLAGMPDGSTASSGDVAPDESPVLVPLTLVPGSTLTFDASGCVSYGPSGCTGNNPDGSSGGQHASGAENGISNVISTWNSLIGVFLGPDQPNISTAPAALNFGTTASRDFATLSPLLQQTFFIGDGRTSSSQVQEFVVPAGATRLFLGTMDGFGWYNNSGAFTVTVNSSTLEPPLPNWTIELDAGADGSVDASDITDANGNYSFTTLFPNTYRVREVQQPEWTQTTADPADITVSASGQVFAGIDFGNRHDDCPPPGVIIGDPEPFDLTGFSVVQYSLGLQGNANWQLSNNNTVATQVNNSDPSIFLSSEILTDDVAEGSWMVNPSGGDDDLMGFVFGYQDTEHFYLFDWKRGSQSYFGFAEQGMSVKVVNASSPLTASDLWPSAGNGTRVQTLYHNTIQWQHGVEYDFRLETRPGEFTITVYQGNVVLDSITIQDSTYSSGKFGFYNFSQGPVSYSGFTRAAITPIPTTTIAGTKFHDLDGDGVRDNGEPGLAGWTIQLDAGANGSVDETTTTDADGTYHFADLPVGTYRIREVPQPGWTQTSVDPQDVVLTTCTDVISGVDFGNLDRSRITGQKFYDVNGNMTQDAGENGLAYWPIFLDANGDGAYTVGEPLTHTNLLGNYSFNDLDPGTYRVREVQQPGWVQTTANPADVTITANGQVFADVDFGNDRDNQTLITGTKFNDLNGDGDQDSGEGGLAYWPIFVDANQNNAYDPGERLTFTNIGGHYAIAGLPVGSYSIREIQRPGWTQTTLNPADVVVTVDGQTLAGGDFGNQRDATTLITGRKFFDADSDGVNDLGEPGLRYWPIFLDTNGDGTHQSAEPVTWTDWNGFYHFAGVAPGTYRVREIQQLGWTQTTADPADVVVTADGQTFEDIDFGNYRTGGAGGIDPPTDLEIIKGAIRAVAGEQITYTLTVTNKGPADSYGVILGDQLAPGLVYESATPSQGVCYGGQTIICAVGPLAVGESASVTIVAHVQSWVVDEIENESCVYSSTTDTDSANNCSIVRTPIDTRTELELVKTADGLRAIAGTDLTYTMRVTNNGPSDSTNVTLEDELPPEVTFVSAVSTHGTCTLEVNTVVCDLGTVANDETAIVTLVVHVGPWVPEDAIITNEARVRDRIGSGGTGIIRIPCGRSADMELTKTGPFTTIDAQVYYIIEVTNHGPSNSAGPIVGDDLPDDINFLSAVPSQGFCNQADPLLCNLGPMVVGQTETVTVFVGVPETTVIENVRNEAVVQPPEGDPNLENNTGGTGGGIRPIYGLGIVKTAPPEIPAGEYLTYTLEVTNEGPDNASNVIVGDTIPAGLIFVSATPTQGTCHSIFNPILCFLGPMTVGQTEEVEIVVFVPPSIPEGFEFVNRGYGWGGIEPVFGDATTRVIRRADIAIEKIAPPDVIAGTEMTYTLRTRNRGPSDSTNITLEDVLPPEVDFVSATPTQGTCTDTEDAGQTTVSCDLGDIPSGGVAEVEITVFVPSFTIPGTIIANGVCLENYRYDPDLTNNCAYVETGVGEQSDTGLIKISTPLPVTAGENIEYTLEAFNLGPSDARQFVLGDTLPAPLVFVSASTTQGTCDYVAGTVVCDIGYLAAGQHEFVTIVAFVPPTTPDGTVIENTACIIECGHDIFHDNDCSTVRNTISAKSELTGVKFNDLDGDGLRDAGEPGIEGWQFFLDLDGDNVRDANERSTFTNAAGVYTFNGLGKSTWFVREVQDPGWLQTTANPGGVPVTGLQQTYAGGNFGNKQASLSGFVYIDSDHDGVFDFGEIGIGGVEMRLVGTDDHGDPVDVLVFTDSDGRYTLSSLRPGSYRIVEGQPSGYLDGKDTLGSLGTTAANDEFFVDMGKGEDGTGYNFGELEPAKLSGYVYNDTNDNGQLDFGEQAVPGAQITLTGTNDLNEIINEIVTSDTQGYYEFTDLRPGTYTIHEQQPAGYLDGKDTVGALGGAVANDQFAGITLASASDGINYNFGEHADVGLHQGQTATIGYWQNKNGQALIKSLNGGANSTALGDWLASNFANMYGANAGANNLAGKTNTQVAAYYVTLFKQKGQKLDAQVLATAFAVYVTDSDLAGNNAATYGFTVNAAGTGAATFSVGGSGAAFGVANNTRLTILQILTATNAQTVGGNLYNGSTSLRNLANTVYDGINQGGDI